MKLQIALDCFTIDEALRTLAQIRQYIDIAEIGTGLGLNEGTAAIRAVKREYPDLTVLSDMKIMDGGESLAALAFDAGADIVTVLGATMDATVTAAVDAAKRSGRAVFVDLIAVKDIAQRAAEVDALGVDYVCVHTSYDLRDSVAAPTADLRKIQGAIKHAQAAITGGIKPGALDEIIACNPGIIIVGSGIMGAPDPAAAAKQCYDAMHR